MSHFVIKASREAITPNVAVLPGVGDSVDLELEDGAPESLYQHLVTVGNNWVATSRKHGTSIPLTAEGMAALVYVLQQEMVHLVDKRLLRRSSQNPDSWIHFSGCPGDER
jgi:hypothetical protein